MTDKPKEVVAHELKNVQVTGFSLIDHKKCVACGGSDSNCPHPTGSILLLMEDWLDYYKRLKG